MMLYPQFDYSGACCEFQACFSGFVAGMQHRFGTQHTQSESQVLSHGAQGTVSSVYLYLSAVIVQLRDNLKIELELFKRKENQWTLSVQAFNLREFHSMFSMKRNLFYLRCSHQMQTVISFGVQLKKQQSELKLEAEMTVRALVRNVRACGHPTCSLFHG